LYPRLQLGFWLTETNVFAHLGAKRTKKPNTLTNPLRMGILFAHFILPTLGQKGGKDELGTKSQMQAPSKFEALRYLVFVPSKMAIYGGY
jgi:hypothetical protein